MYDLLRRHFNGVDPARFDADLSEKNWAVLVEDERGDLAGFSTILIRRERWRGEPITVVHSGDTIVRPDAWGSSALPRTWIRSVRALRCAHGEGPLWWLLITSGFRTYRFLPVFCRSFVPRHDGAADAGLRGLADALARRRFRDAYDPRAGVVRLPAPQVLRRGLDVIPDGRRGDPHVAFFERANPGHVRGDELVSLASLEDENLTPSGLRMLYGASARVLGSARTDSAGEPVVSSGALNGAAGVPAGADEP
jgi:hypothetical protein